VSTCVNEKQFKTLKKRVEENGTSIYAVLKKGVKEFLEEEKAKVCLGYLWLCYGLAASTVALLFCV